eukprot:s358_g16.t1
MTLHNFNADVNAMNSKGQSPLHLAAKAGLGDVMHWLAAKASPDVLSSKDAICQLFCNACARASQSCLEPWTPIWLSAPCSAVCAVRAALRRKSEDETVRREQRRCGVSQKREDAGARKGVALGDICLRFVWQAWHLVTSAFVSCGSSGGGLGRRWSPVAPRLFCVAGVALGDICLRFVWQAWHSRWWRPCSPWRRASFAWQALHLATSAFVLCGRRGTYGTALALVAALVAAGSLWRRASFAWQAWHLATFAFVLCGRCGTW